MRKDIYVIVRIFSETYECVGPTRSEKLTKFRCVSPPNGEVRELGLFNGRHGRKWTPQRFSRCNETRGSGLSLRHPRDKNEHQETATDGATWKHSGHRPGMLSRERRKLILTVFLPANF